jgi:hypothetical protein
MRITDLRREITSASARVVASVEFEDCDRPRTEVAYEVPAEFGGLLLENPDVFLVGAVLPAARNGERRLSIDGAVCPRLTYGIVTVLHWMAHWYGPRWRDLQLEVRPRAFPLEVRNVRRTAMFLSGGVDSLAALRMNRLAVPRSHPASIADGILVRGFSHRDERNFGPALKAAEAVAEDAGLRLVPLTTNIRLLDWDSEFWLKQFHGAALCSAAHLFVQHVSAVHHASSYDLPHLVPAGSHPALDANYGSYDLSVLHDGVHLSRMAKTAVVAEWPAGLANLRVCTGAPEIGAPNCGQCEKCVRTRLQLLALGVETAGAFGEGTLRVEAIENIQIRSDYAVICYTDSIEPLERRGLHGHARAAKRAVAEYRAYLAAMGGKDLKAKLRHFDRQVLGGALLRMRSLMRSAVKAR